MALRTDASHDMERLPLAVFPNRTSVIDSVEGARRALHEAVEIKYFYEGASTLLIGTRTVEARAGDVVVINPYEFHATLDYGAEKGKYHLFMLELDFLSGAGGEPDLRHLLLGRQVVFRSHFPADRTLGELLSHAAQEAREAAPMHRLALKGILTQVLAYLLREGIDSTAAHAPHADGIRYYSVIDPALCRIRDGYAEHFTVDALASLCRVSKYHFCRVFKQVTGMSAMQYLNDYRLKVADTMLSNTERSVGEVAALCGFEDEGYFCRCYKRRYGVSPLKRRSERA
ncbi:MAG: AraC family transcriptional regulator [Clostridia bacterium]|nr:AraC family transcriptional regulator [Clostridia bacterium]MBQ9774218.1 AraC family transcriptional regulator [Clostridia bacterium]